MREVVVGRVVADQTLEPGRCLRPHQELATDLARGIALAIPLSPDRRESACARSGAKMRLLARGRGPVPRVAFLSGAKGSGAWGFNGGAGA